MSRLIDADKFMDFIKDELKQDRPDNIHIRNIIRVLEDLPSAFDVDKVVVKIQAQAEMQLQRGIQENEPACLYASSCYAKAAEIVERGGIYD